MSGGASFDKRRWDDLIGKALEEGWPINRATGEYEDDDEEYSRDSKRRRTTLHNALQTLLPPAAQAPRDKDEDSGANEDTSRNSNGAAVSDGNASDSEAADNSEANTERALAIVRPSVPPLTARDIMHLATAPTEVHDMHTFVFVDRHDQEQYTQAWCELALEKALNRWCPRNEDARHYDYPVKVACKRFQLDWDGHTMPPAINKSLLTQRYLQKIGASFQLLQRGYQSAAITAIFEEDVKRVQASIHAAYHLLMQLEYFYDTWRGEGARPYCTPHDMNAYRFVPEAILTEGTDLQKVIYFLNCKISEFRFRRYNDYFCQRVFNNDGVFVHTYKQAIPVEDFSYKFVNMNERFDLWQAFVQPGHAAAVAKHLAKDQSIPDLVKNRNVHAFRNGLYFVREDHFHAWTDGPVSSNVTACKYHPFDFEPYSDLQGVDFEGTLGADSEADGGDDIGGPRMAGTAWDIPTPLFDKINIAQRHSYQVRAWNFAFIGRLLYETGALDQWQVWQFHYGLSGTGKSTVVKIFSRYFFDEEDMGPISNTWEKQFGLWGIADKFGVYADEVGEDFGIDRTELQQMISGETIKVSRKGLKSAQKRFTAPGIMGGNHIPNWRDPQCAMPRRLVVMKYNRAVQAEDMDSKLFARIAAEIPNIIVKCNRFYLAAVKHVGDRGVWSCLPKYFKSNQMTLQQTTSAMHGFMASEDLTIVKEEDGTPCDTVYMPLALLKEKYRAWQQENNIRTAPRWSVETYSKALSDAGLRPPVKTRRPYPRDNGTASLAQQQFVIGIDTTDEMQRVGRSPQAHAAALADAGTRHLALLLNSADTPHGNGNDGE